ncbi:MAG: PAS domain S-box protein [Rhodospirillales bacterium]|nr:PAS domain S-box protein [Rhodospirillales bacterium]
METEPTQEPPNWSDVGRETLSAETMGAAQRHAANGPKVPVSQQIARTRLLYQKALVPLLGNLVVGALLAIGLYGHVSNGLLFLWAGAVALTVLGRYLLCLQFPRHGVHNPHKWARLYALGALCSGGIWAAAVGLIWGETDTVNSLLVAFMLAGITAGAIVSSSSYVPAVLAYIVPPLVTLAIYFFAYGDVPHAVMGLVTLFYLAYLARTATDLQVSSSGFHLLDQRNRLILDGAEEGICGLDREGNIVFANPAAARMVGYGVNELIGTHLEDLTGHVPRSGEPTQGGGRLIDTLISDGQTVRVDDRLFHRRDGSVFLVDYTGTPLRNEVNEIEGAVLTFRDASRRAEAVRLLKQEESRFRDFASATSDWFWETDNQGRFTYLSDQFQKFSGQSPDTFVGQPFWEVAKMFDSRADAVNWGHLQKQVAAGEPFRDLFFPFKDAQGRIRLIQAGGVPVRNVLSGAVNGYRGTARDVTDMKEVERKLKENEERFALALRASNDALFDWSFENNRMFLSPRIYEMFGGDPSEVGDPASEWWDSLHPEDRSRVEEAINGFLASDADQYELEYRLRHQNGQYLKVLNRSFVIRDENRKAIRVVGVISDVTQQRRAEEELREAKQIAEHANHAKSQFLSSMSHELRTPMNSILGFAQVLKMTPAVSDDDDQSECVDQILKAGGFLLGLIDDVLELSKIESGKIPLSIEDISINDLVKGTADLVGSMAKKKDITIIDTVAGSELPAARADYARCRQILLNLLSNAIKYNRDGGTVTIACRKNDGESLRLSVTDTGVGIPEDKHAQLFQPFNRLGAENSNIEGTGIGLAITKQLIELQQGSIGFESTVGAGTTLWVDLPVGASAPSMRRGELEIDVIAGPEDTRLEGATILYVEDKPANLRLFEKVFSRIPGLTVLSAHNAEFGLDIAERLLPDVIVMDINLPGLDGFQALEALKQMTATKDIPVIALSANVMPRDVERGRQVGFFKYLTKPLNIALTRKTISDALVSVQDRSGADL